MSSFTEWLRSVGLAGYAVSQQFGANPGRNGYGGDGHHGTDIAAPIGTPLRVPGGVVRVSAGQQLDKNGALDGWGRYLRYFYADGSYSQLSHLSEWVGIKPGQSISNPLPGTVFGKSGSSGNSTGPHVDIERRTASGGLLNPATASYAAGAPKTVWEKLKSLNIDFSHWNSTEKKSYEEQYNPATGLFRELPAGYERLTPAALKAFTKIDTTQAGWESTPEAQVYSGDGMAGEWRQALTKIAVNGGGVLAALALFWAGIYLLGRDF